MTRKLGLRIGGLPTLTLEWVAETIGVDPELKLSGFVGLLETDDIKVVVEGTTFTRTLGPADAGSLFLDIVTGALANGTYHATGYHYRSGAEVAFSNTITFDVNDTTAPIASNVGGAVQTSTILRVTFDTNESGGTAFAVAVPNETEPDVPQVIAGKNYLGVTAPNANVPVGAAGQVTIDVTVPDFTPRKIAVVHRDAGLNPSNKLVTALLTPYITPAEVPSMQHWYDAGDENTVTPYLSGIQVTKVADKIGTLDLVPSAQTTNGRPTYPGTTVNGRKVVVFSNAGSSQTLGWFTTPPPAITGGAFYWAMCCQIAAGGVNSTFDALMACSDPTNPRYDFSLLANNASAFDGQLFLRELGASVNFSPTGISEDVTHLVEVEFKPAPSGTLTVWVDGVQRAQRSHSQAALTPTTAQIFASGVNVMYGNFCEQFIANDLIVGGAYHAGLKAGVNARRGTSL